MYLDKMLEFDPANTAVTVTADSVNILDMGVARDMGSAPEGIGTLEIGVFVTTAFTAGGAATLNIQIQGAAESAPGSGVPGAFTVLAESGPIPKASLVAGARFDVVVPSQIPGAAIPRFYKLTYTVATGPFLTGKLQAELTSGLEHQPVGTTSVLSGYAAGVTVNN